MGTQVTATDWCSGTKTKRPTVPATTCPTSTVEGRRNGKEPRCKVGFFVFQDLNHSPQILSERMHFRRQRAGNSGGMFLMDVQIFTFTVFTVP